MAGARVGESAVNGTMLAFPSLLRFLSDSEAEEQSPEQVARLLCKVAGDAINKGGCWRLRQGGDPGCFHRGQGQGGAQRLEGQLRPRASGLSA